MHFGIQLLSHNLLKDRRKSRESVLMGPISAPNFSQKEDKNFPYRFPKACVVTLFINCNKFKLLIL